MYPASILKLVGPNKKIPVFGVTGLYLNLLVKPSFFSGFLGKNVIFCILKGEMLSKCIKLFFFYRKKNVCLSYLKFSDLLPETLIFFLLGLV